MMETFHFNAAFSVLNINSAFDQRTTIVLQS
ncbi:hypothetical protein AF40_02841 [Enterobacter roggenkampii MGH 54]|nr:hypothetical protein AF40_02841 [Enterobacter roggenkampii MGH 54]